MKSNPIPESATSAGAAREALVMVKPPLCCPALVGANAICTTQVAAASREVPHVVNVAANPGEVESLRSASVTGLLLVSTNDWGVPVNPTPVKGNCIKPG